MKRFQITVRTLLTFKQYTAIAKSSTDAHINAISTHGACGVTVRPL